MFKELLKKIRKKPLDLLTRGFYKLFIGRIKYYKRQDYDAARYWQDRFLHYGLSLRAAGDEGLSEDENKEMYAKAAEVFINLCKSANINFKDAKVLEVGCGTGFYTSLLYKLGVRKYTGVDITEVFFPVLKERYPDFKFIKKDVTIPHSIEGNFDLVIMIDVMEHIVNRKKFSYCMQNIKHSLLGNAIVILAPISQNSKDKFFYLRTWTLLDIKNEFSEDCLLFSELMSFRNQYILFIKNRQG